MIFTLHNSLRSCSSARRCCRQHLQRLEKVPVFAPSRYEKNSTNSFQRNFSATASKLIEQQHPLMLWLGSNSKENDATSVAPLLYPSASVDSIPVVETPHDVLAIVNEHYNQEQHFVGGMGEQDLGVLFVGGITTDPLEHAELCQEAIRLVKEERHGIPFGLHTSGILVTPLSVPITEIGLSCLHVSLFAGSPPEYAKATGKSERDFGTVCGFIVDAAEQGIAVEVGVLEQYAGRARDLAISLGAQNVHIYSR